ncbi:PIR Superfamily Protein [Plasmodium ovale wallikeri]|uniref:PIR Superfamily Protein n=1 Tax=Plasmodium ovale wallikeri TaxID=864142 RepID=A0A1A9AGQ3_PLAOA|nr:PIR Superfamily Protein [Plasmodium ovale wallikeri]
MLLEIPTTYNVASSYKEYKTYLDSYKKEEITTYMFGCEKFINQYLNDAEDPALNVCYAVMKFLNLLEEKNYTQKEKGCKYLFYWLHAEVLRSKQPIKNTLNLYKELYKNYHSEENLNTLDNYINQINEHTSDKLVKLTGIYDKLEHFSSEYELKHEKKTCTGDCMDLYNTYVDECRKGYDKDFCNELKNFREKYHFFIKKILSYEGEQYLLPPVESFNTLNVIIIPFTLILVTSLIFPILYKFTAFGPWIRRIIGKNNNMWENINEETN